MTEICKGKTMSNTISKYIVAFDYFDKTLLASSATSGAVSIASFATVISALAGITSADLILVFYTSNNYF